MSTKTKSQILPEACFALISSFFSEKDEAAEVLNKLAGEVGCRTERNGKTYRNGLLHSYDENPAVNHDGIQIWYYRGRIHRDHDLPAVITPSRKIWYQYGKRHRSTVDENKHTLPAVIMNSYEEWWIDGELHRDHDLPAVVSHAPYVDGNDTKDEEMLKEYTFEEYPHYRLDGTRVWYSHGKRHRISKDENGYVNPAFVWDEGYMWYVNDLLHRENDLPAVENAHEQEWWFNGELHRENDQPAILSVVRKEWWFHGRPHRENDLPAKISIDRKEWWIDGRLKKKELSCECSDCVRELIECDVQ